MTQPKKWRIAMWTALKTGAQKITYYNVEAGQKVAHYNVEAGQKTAENQEENCNSQGTGVVLLALS